MDHLDLVSVIIPAFNAAVTIGETLLSVRSQTHRRLEIIVVDDGSEDLTPQIVLKHADEDRRVQLIQQPNAGVAAARNRGIAASTSSFVAPIDADDLWRPDKIERQLAALHQGGEAVALVYTWSAIIDRHSRIIGYSPGPTYTGMVLDNFLQGNFCGNGSCVLMRKQAIVEAGGYDPSLRARSAQGFEDFQLYFRIAARHEFAVVPDHLTGYRWMPTSMSADVLQMLRSWDLVSEEICSRYPERASTIRALRVYFLGYLYDRGLKAQRWRAALRLGAMLIQQRPLSGTKQVFLSPARRLARRIVSWQLSAWNRKEAPAVMRRFATEIPG
jgi:glycosyltransferase involved in cell wall biosynthesis